MTTETITISGMSCDGCVTGVRRAMERLGISDAEVEIGRARVTYDPARLTHADIVEAIEDAGFDVEE